MKKILFLLLSLSSITSQAYQGWYETIDELKAANPGKTGVAVMYLAGEYDERYYLNMLYSFQDAIQARYGNEKLECFIGELSQVKFAKDEGWVIDNIPAYLITNEFIQIRRDYSTQTLTYTTQEASRYFEGDHVRSRPFKVERSGVGYSVPKCK